MPVPISNVTRRVVYSASGTGPYAFTFEILANTDIAVYKDDTLLTLTTDYTVTINANGTGSITLTASPTGATQIAIVGNRTIQRTTDFVTGGDFFANTVNDELDQQTIFAQQNAEGLQRALQAPQTDPTSINMILPRASVRASKVLSFDASGNPSATEFIGSNRGNWAASTTYYVRDIVKDTSTSNIWQCLVQHTSSGSQPISTNTDSAKWFLLVDAASAGASASAAAASASAAATSASNASTSATNAASSASTASTQASNASTSATNAANSATAAASSASTASTAATNAGNSATAAASSATSASNSASSASTSASNAASSASSASTSASNASTSATNAANSATSAASSATTATNQATTATTQATNAANSATAAAASAAAAAASFDAFDDIYLGAKSSDPSVDNDGNALTTGDQYFNTVANELRVYNGSTWQAASTVGGTVTSLTVTGATTLNQNPTLSAGTANGVLYLNGSKVATSGSALVFDGTVLTVGSATFPSGRIRLKQADDTTKQKGLLIETAADDSLLAIGYNSGAFTYNATYNTTGSYQPQAWWVSGSEQMRLTSTGLGIGTSSPAAKLHVSTSAAGIAEPVWLNNSQAVGAGVGSRLVFTGTTSNNGLAAIDGAFAGATTADGGYMVFNTRAVTSGALTERMRLDASGNLGLGVTPSAWGSLQSNIKAIQVGTWGGIWRDGGQGWMSMSNNAYWENSSSPKYIGNYAAAWYNQSLSGQHQWYNAPSGTAGTGITFTQAMTLDASGNLGLGTTSPTSGAKLDVNGQIVAQNGSTSSLGYAFRLALSSGMYLYDDGVGANVVLQANANNNQLYLQRTGNVGIGTSSPNSKLSFGSGYISTDKPNLIRLYDSGTDAGSVGFGVNGAKDSIGQLGIYAGGAATIGFFTGGLNERARIDSSGNFMVGTTSSTVWNGSAGTKVVVGGSGNTITSLQSSTTTVDQGAIFEGYATGISSNSAALGSIAFLRSNTSTTALSSYTAFYTNNAGTVAERARITSGGDLLVGTTSSAANSGTGVKLLPSGYVYVVAPSTTSDTYNYYNSTAGAYRFYVTNAGVINATSTTITAISDQRLKENIQDIDVGLDAVMALKPRKFDWKAGKGKDKKGDRGWIAQEFEQVFPDMITTWKDEPPEGEEPYKAVNADLIPVLVKAIQELKAEFDAYKATHP